MTVFPNADAGEAAESHDADDKMQRIKLLCYSISIMIDGRGWKWCDKSRRDERMAMGKNVWGKRVRGADFRTIFVPVWD